MANFVVATIGMKSRRSNGAVYHIDRYPPCTTMVSPTR
eukprot:SAG11_NODE_5782_length_1465_cov_0.901903_3_plen_37_part_01